MKVGVGPVVAVFALSILGLSVGNVLLKIATAPGAESAYSSSHRLWAGILGMVLMTAQFAGMLLLERWGLDVSVVVPVFGINFAITALLGAVWLGESVSAMRWYGILAMLVGVVLIARSQGR